jgi:DDE superfamily endonuclease
VNDNKLLCKIFLSKHLLTMNQNFFDSLLSDSEDDEDNCSNLMIIAAVISTASKKQRISFFVRDRIEWEDHVAKLLSEGESAFARMYRMSHGSFTKLCSILHPHLTMNAEMSSLRTKKGPITTEIALHCLLRWMAGGSYLDIRLCAGVSKSSFYLCVYRCIDAILQCKELAYSFPTENESIKIAANEWKELSSSGVINGCVACMDGLLLRIQTPSSKETGNVKAYFSGHYQDYGINVQAACDSRCRFVFVQLAAPGGVNDIAAFRKSHLRQMIDNLPLGYYVIGDNAYVCSEHILTPFPGSQKTDPKKDAYNFYLSQLRIRIEMAFGRLVNKWRILKRPLQTRLKNTGRLFLCATRLHNFCINESDNAETYTTTNESGNDEGYLPSDVQATTIEGTSMIRDILVDRIASMGLSRPVYNLQRSNELF